MIRSVRGHGVVPQRAASATVELKNPNTGQNADHAIAQYRLPGPDEVFFAKRALVHFAVDPDRAFITTRLRGRDTQFLPFNVGSNGAGVAGGAGNPPAARSYCVAYLWEQIWQRGQLAGDPAPVHPHPGTAQGRAGRIRTPRRASSPLPPVGRRAEAHRHAQVNGPGTAT